jgi:hypothetical protein
MNWHTANLRKKRKQARRANPVPVIWSIARGTPIDDFLRVRELFDRKMFESVMLPAPKPQTEANEWTSAVADVRFSLEIPLSEEQIHDLYQAFGLNPTEDSAEQFIKDIERWLAANEDERLAE